MDKVARGFALGQGLLCVLCYLVTHCTCCSSSTRSKAAVVQEVSKQNCVWKNPPTRRTLQVQIDENNLRFDTDLQARTYLVKKLRALLAKRLVEEGFSTKWALVKVQSMQPCAWQMRPHEEKVYGTGVEAGLIKQVVLWDLVADFRLDLKDEDINGLLRGLSQRPLQSFRDALDLVDQTKMFAKLTPPKIEFDQFMHTLSSKWLALLQDELQNQLQSGKTTQQIVVVLEQVAAHVHRYRQTFPNQAAVVQALTSIQPAFRKAALAALHRVPVNAKRVEKRKDVIQELERVVRSVWPDLVSFLRRDLELTWRDRLLELEKRRLPFSAVRDEFVGFVQLFPSAEASLDLRTRFLTRFANFLAETTPRDVDALRKMQHDVLLYQTLCPTTEQTSRVYRCLERCQCSYPDEGGGQTSG